MLRLYIDESGHHATSLKKIKNSCKPAFVLCACIFDSRYEMKVAQPLLRKLKEANKIDPDIPLHLHDILKGQRGFESLNTRRKKEKFISETCSVLDKMTFKIIACIVDKPAYLESGGVSKIRDPYEYSFEILVERFCYELGENIRGLIIAESRGKKLDNIINTLWQNFRRSGTRYVDAREVKRKIVQENIIFQPKQRSLPGLEIADFFALPLNRLYCKKDPVIELKLIKRKLRRAGSKIQGYGLIVRPRGLQFLYKSCSQL